MTDIPFPYPVLGNNGDIDGSFDVTIIIDFSIVGFYTLNCDFKLNNEYYLIQGEHSKIIKNPKKTIKTSNLSLDEILEEYDGPLEFWFY